MDLSSNTIAIILLVVAVIASLVMWALEGLNSANIKQKLRRAEEDVEHKERSLEYLKLRHKRLESERKAQEDTVNALELEREQLLQAIEHQKGTNTPEAMVKALKTAFEEL